MTEEDLQSGLVYPKIGMIRHVSASIAAGVAKAMHDTGRASNPMPKGDLLKHCKAIMYDPTYDFQV